MIYPNPKVIAEIGGNHCGSLDIAKQMIVAAKAAGADYVKFQKRCPKELLHPDQYAGPHPNPRHTYGDTYGEHREFLEFNIKQHVELADFCEDTGIKYATSVWDMTSAKEVADHICPEYIKIPSAQNQNEELAEYLMTQYMGDVHISMGMLTRLEMCHIYSGSKALNYSYPVNYFPRLVYYACTSGYPVPFEKVFLQELNWLDRYEGEFRARRGFSGHHLGIAVDIAAYTLGAEFIERHFTLDRTWKGTDHACSLEPQGLQKLVRDLKAVHSALAYKPGSNMDLTQMGQMDPLEVEQRNKLKYRGEDKKHEDNQNSIV